MLQSVSPYALLKMSKPKSSSEQGTLYDAWSSYVQQSAAPAPEPAQTLPAEPVHQAPPAKRTHYISDIHARHTIASKRTGQAQQTL